MPYPFLRVVVIRSHPSLPGTERERSLQMEISFTNVNFSHKRGTYSLSSELLLCFLGLKIIFMPKDIFWGGIFWSFTLVTIC